MYVRCLIVLSGMMFGMMAPTAAVADPRDSVDRSQRLDTDALRDDIGTNRLRAPSHPLVIAPERSGFGRAMIESVVGKALEGDVKLSFPPKGVRCVIVIPETQVASRG